MAAHSVVCVEHGLRIPVSCSVATSRSAADPFVVATMAGRGDVPLGAYGESATKPRIGFLYSGQGSLRVVNAVNAQNLTLPSGLAKIGDPQYGAH